MGYTKTGKEFYFDIDDFDIVKQYYWKVGSSRGIYASGELPSLSLHKLIMGKGIYIHKNGNKADNRKQNLVCARGFKNSGKTFLNGYIAVYCPEHERAFENGCVYEHIIVAEKILGRHLTINECVHHKDKDKTNNNETNLMIFSTNEDHISYHAGGNAILQQNGTYKTESVTTKLMHRDEIEDNINNDIIDSNSTIIINKTKYNLCPVCNVNLKTHDAQMCKSCRCKIRASHIPSKTYLKSLIYSIPFTQIGHMYGVSDNAVKKWCKKYELPFRKKDLYTYQEHS